MNKTLLIVSLFTSLAIASLNSYAEKNGYYRWSADDGKTHFTQQPPNGRPSVFIKTASGYSSNSGADKDGQAVSESKDQRNPDSPADAIPEKMEVLPPKNPELCAKAQSNMQSLDANGARIRISNADGSSRFLNGDEIAEQKTRAQEVIKVHCG